MLACDQSTTIFTDHRNLLYAFHPTALEPFLGRHKVMKVICCQHIPCSPVGVVSVHFQLQNIPHSWTAQYDPRHSHEMDARLPWPDAVNYKNLSSPQRTQCATRPCNVQCRLVYNINASRRSNLHSDYMPSDFTSDCDALARHGGKV